MLDADQQRAVLRQAAMLVLAGDEAGVGALRPLAARLPAGPVAEGFAALTAESLKGLGSLLSGGAEVLGKILKTPPAGEPSEGTFDLYEIVIEAHQTVLKKVPVR